MAEARKNAFLQIRVSPSQKAALRRQARRVGMDVSRFVLDRVLPEWGTQLQSLLDRLTKKPMDAALLAAIGDALREISTPGFIGATAALGVHHLGDLDRTLIAAMVEHAAALKGVSAPPWTMKIGPLKEPYFASALPSLRLHLLTASPPPYRRRNLFLDASLDDRV